MKKENNIVITFKSTHYAIQAEEVFKENKIDFKTIPTPREISNSCGLAILFESDGLDKVKGIIDKGDLKVDSVYRYAKEKSGGVEKII